MPAFKAQSQSLDFSLRSLLLFTLSARFNIGYHMSEHHLILGKTVDLITGAVIDDTHDERYRQKIARLLVETKGYLKGDIIPDVKLPFSIDGNNSEVRIDFVVRVDETTIMIIRYAPGSLVTRERPSVAAARLLESYQIPVTVVTNGRDAQIMDTCSGKVVGHGLDAIPSKKEASAIIDKREFQSIPAKQAEKEARILYVFDVVGSCTWNLGRRTGKDV